MFRIYKDLSVNRFGPFKHTSKRDHVDIVILACNDSLTNADCKNDEGYKTPKMSPKLKKDDLKSEILC